MKRLFDDDSGELVGGLAIAVQDVHHELSVERLGDFLDALLGRDNWNVFELLIDFLFYDVLAHLVLHLVNIILFAPVHIGLGVTNLYVGKSSNVL